MDSSTPYRSIDTDGRTIGLIDGRIKEQIDG